MVSGIFGSLVLRTPNDTIDRLFAFAKLRAAEMHFTRARRLASTGKYEEAVIEYELAHELNPTSSDVETELRKARLAVRNKVAVPADGKTQLEALVERTRDMPNSTYELPRDARLPPSLLFREASSRDVFTTLARVANLNVIFDPSFRESPVTTELHDVTFEDALTSITTSGRALSMAEMMRAAAFNLSGVSLIVIAFAPGTPAIRRRSMTIRSRSIVSLRSALLR